MRDTTQETRCRGRSCINDQGAGVERVNVGCRERHGSGKATQSSASHASLSTSICESSSTLNLGFLLCHQSFWAMGRISSGEMR